MKELIAIILFFAGLMIFGEMAYRDIGNGQVTNRGMGGDIHSDNRYRARANLAG